MEHVTNFTPAECRRVAKVMEDALVGPLAELGLTVEFAGGKYDRTGSYTPKVTVRANGSAEREFASVASLVGLEAEDFGREFTVRGETYRVTGVNLKAPKFPVLAERVSDGRGFKFPEPTVRVAFGRPANRWAAEAAAENAAEARVS